ncbi:MAG: DNA polymerase III subunit delta' [Planctomycetaceae bacterium]
MIWQNVRGHQHQVEMFRRSIRRGRLAHAYLFVGDEGIGKQTFARTLCQCLLCQRCDDAQLDACGECHACRQMQAGSHPDFLSIGRPEGKSDLPIKLIAGSPERRGREGLCFDLSLRPIAGDRRLAIIDDADHMNAVSANALLKTLEEPPDYSLIFLISATAETLLPTIRSRCQLVRFSPLPSADVAYLLGKLEVVESLEEANQLAALSGGSLAAARQLLDPQLRTLRLQLVKALADPRFDSVATTRKILEGLDELGGETQDQRQAAVWLIRFVVDFFRLVIHQLSHGDEAAGSNEDVARFAARLEPGNATHLELLMELIERSAAAIEQIDHKTAVPLCLEGLLDDLGRILRRIAVQPSAVLARNT